jgi:hypothetical protein
MSNHREHRGQRDCLMGFLVSSAFSASSLVYMLDCNEMKVCSQDRSRLGAGGGGGLRRLP